MTIDVSEENRSVRHGGATASTAGRRGSSRGFRVDRCARIPDGGLRVVSRRRVLATLAGTAAVGLAGCSNSPADADDSRATADPSGQDATPADDGSAETSTPAAAAVDESIGNWPLFGWDPGRTNHAPEGSGPTGSVTPTWSTDVTDERSVSAPVLADGRLFFTSWAARLHAVSAADGTVLWEHPIDERVSTVPAVGGDTVVVSSTTNTYGLAAADGTVRWRGPGSRGGPLVVDDTVYLVDSASPEGDGTDRLFALSLEDGSERWRTDEEFSGGDRGIAAADGTIILVRTPADPNVLNQAVALDAATGEQQWQTKLPFSELKCPPAIAAGTAYVFATGMTLALDLSTGEIQWRADYGSEFNAAVADGTVYVPTQTEDLVTLDAATGEVQWTYNNGRWLMNDAALVGGTVYAMSNNDVMALSPEDGTRQWRYEFEDASPLGLVVADEQLFVTGSTGQIFALSP